MSVSVIIPCYNNSATIKRALKSVQQQSLKPLEVIIVDDASHDFDKTLAIINLFNDPVPKIINHETNKNGSAARNTGIIAAIGDYIAFLDADDEWKSDHLKCSINFLEENKIDICTSKCEIQNANGIFISPSLVRAC